MLEQEQADTAAEDQLCQDQVVQQYFNTYELMLHILQTCLPPVIQTLFSWEAAPSWTVPDWRPVKHCVESRADLGRVSLCSVAPAQSGMISSLYDDDDDDVDRLVSGGEYDNSVTVLVKAATDADLDFDNNLVMTCPEFLGNA